MLIFFILKLEASTNETTLESFTPNNRLLHSFLHVHQFNKREGETLINASEFDLVDIKISEYSQESESSNCNGEKTSDTSKLISPNMISDNQQTTNLFFDLWETFSCGFVLCCSVLLTIVIIASYYCYDKNEKVWGLLLTIGFILSMVIFGAVITGVEKLKARNQRFY